MKLQSFLSVKLIALVAIISSCASTVIIPAGSKTSTIEVKNNLKGSMYLQRTGVGENCSGGWGDKIIAKKNEIAKGFAISNEEESFFMESYPISNTSCLAIVTVNLKESDTISLSFNRKEDGTCFVDGQTESVRIREYVRPKKAIDGFCK